MIKPAKQGKVRDIYDFGDRLVLVATDRISAYDSILPDDIPSKGRVLTLLSAFWFGKTQDIIKNHLISTEVGDLPVELESMEEHLKGRSMLVKQAQVYPVECVVRGYLSGSAWSEYKKMGSVCGIELAKGLVESDKLFEPIFTPSTKAESGHDENITFDQMQEIVGEKIAARLKEASIKLYKFASEFAEERGIIIADTKFEFGEFEGEPMLIDEIFTPDSSRFWDKAEYCPGCSQKSFDKQFVRDYLDEIGWNHEPPAPRLSEEVIEGTRKRYLEAFRRLTGEELKV
ncbi:MAG: phosphoribosylaminoimidazolesuccinocarboxamide synthase [Actinomycetota bacterium]|nr:phosphoribosylaminoimidazolesuccinocarboxamide synthase [Actinomycetota bacterium]